MGVCNVMLVHISRTDCFWHCNGYDAVCKKCSGRIDVTRKVKRQERQVKRP